MNRLILAIIFLIFLISGVNCTNEEDRAKDSESICLELLEFYILSGGYYSRVGCYVNTEGTKIKLTKYLEDKDIISSSDAYFMNQKIRRLN